MRIKRFNEVNDIDENLDSSLLGISNSQGRRTGTKNPNRRSQYFYDYYTGGKISGKSKYELSSRVFNLAKRDDDIGLLAQFCLQIERDSITNDYTLTDRLDSNDN